MKFFLDVYPLSRHADNAKGSIEIIKEKEKQKLEKELEKEKSQEEENFGRN